VAKKDLIMPDQPEEGWKQSPAYTRELEKLPEESHRAYELLVGEYRYHALVNHRHPFVSYKVLAALIREGWRPMERDD
jgi:hypothetical protein